MASRSWPKVSQKMPSPKAVCTRTSCASQAAAVLLPRPADPAMPTATAGASRVAKPLPTMTSMLPPPDRPLSSLSRKFSCSGRSTWCEGKRGTLCSFSAGSGASSTGSPAGMGSPALRSRGGIGSASAHAWTDLPLAPRTREATSIARSPCSNASRTSRPLSFSPNRGARQPKRPIEKSFAAMSAVPVDQPMAGTRKPVLMVSQSSSVEQPLSTTSSTCRLAAPSTSASVEGGMSSSAPDALASPSVVSPANGSRASPWPMKHTTRGSQLIISVLSAEAPPSPSVSVVQCHARPLMRRSSPMASASSGA
mmetsp:Transcript_26853/g.90525  ORF Transcript_26853/g.90525 Transcript_26853/m.90525 type:complete len:309 (+) Transcript_26853:946-1872(+)